MNSYEMHIFSTRRMLKANKKTALVHTGIVTWKYIKIKGLPAIFVAYVQTSVT